MLVDAKYLRVGNRLFLCVQGWGREHKVKHVVNSWRFASMVHDSFVSHYLHNINIEKKVFTTDEYKVK